MRKVYRLFGIPVWSVDVTDITAEEGVEESDPAANLDPLQATIQLSDGNPPAFGFTPIPFYWDDEE